MTDTPSRSLGMKTIRASGQPRDLMAERSRVGAWQARVVTLFPEAFPGVLGHSLTGTALKDGLWELAATDLRRFGLTKHRSVDDTPAGGGAGLVLRADVVGPALEAARGPGPMIYLSPRGTPFTQAMARELVAGPGVTLLCGRFEGVDQRVLDHYAMTEVSMGDYVLTGGEIAAQALLDATVRLLPGVLGNMASTEEESFSDGLLEHPQFTKPAEWQGRPIPEVLLSGNHGKVAAWRREQAEALTRERRPDLWAAYRDPTAR
ncbi:tRNA (guanosine(37)-N1)-methyltransferase TrmD [Jannaschia pohangensis]|uniref:tRNA (guanine-N(1)-)-methyltransferase n=1 Tax=Jannaschia pohangensis TaxID=390807 RepID=A0A1I3QQM1_9RHOB|nr:tRNA (guanosine(37)-N1)-methyltransferase TrmD [Jannaschia pohangensis]SFJ35732.1 tRNA (Guanine37-N(1)-) methyltransferase [Jannaschia pohangensis]